MNEKMIAGFVIVLLLAAGIAIAAAVATNVQADDVEAKVVANNADNSYCSGSCSAGSGGCGNPSCGVEKTGSCGCGR